MLRRLARTLRRALAGEEDEGADPGALARLRWPALTASRRDGSTGSGAAGRERGPAAGPARSRRSPASSPSPGSPGGVAASGREDGRP